MTRNRNIERSFDDLGDRVRQYADGATDTAQGWLARGRRVAAERLNGRGYRRQLSHAAEDFADEANYQYRRLRRQVNRHPAATVAIVAGTVGAFLLLRHIFRNGSDAD
jgi:hypothetical protein